MMKAAHRRAPLWESYLVRPCLKVNKHAFGWSDAGGISLAALMADGDGIVLWPDEKAAHFGPAFARFVLDFYLLHLDWPGRPEP